MTPKLYTMTDDELSNVLRVAAKSQHPAWPVMPDVANAAYQLGFERGKEARAALAAPAVPEGYALVPIEPSPGKLISMAIRHDHGLGLPGYYDRDGFFGNGVSHQQRLESIIGQMRQLHEEVVGSGFYSVEKESAYTAIIAASMRVEIDCGATPSALD